MDAKYSDVQVCVIGAGASGLTAIKQCLENGFSVTCYEKTNYIGGLWKYHEDDEDGIASVMASTIINSSKEISSFSDFPADANLPNYMHNKNMMKYLESYCDKFNLKANIKLNHSVEHVKRHPNYDDHGKWIVTVKNKSVNDGTVDIVYDGVMICTGHHVKPLMPTFNNQEQFKGKIIHSHSYKKPTSDMVDTNILVIGVGNSGGDVAVELSNVATNTYLSTRRGVWVAHRVGDNGWPLDCVNLKRSWLGLMNHFPQFVGNYFWEKQLNNKFDHSLYDIKPNHGPTSQHIMINDSLPNKLLSGTIIMKRNVKSFTPDGVVFEGDEKVTQVDIVVMATGYLISFPFLEKGIIDVNEKNNSIKNLYKYVFPANLKHPTLCFIGLIQPIGSIFPISESQSRWFCQLMKGVVSKDGGGKVTLGEGVVCKFPSVEEMLKDIDRKRKEIELRYYEGERHTIQVDWLPYMDEINEQIGSKPDLWFYFFNDFTLWKHLIFGPAIPAHYRLNGPNKWDGAREAILETRKRIMTPLKTRSGHQDEDVNANYVIFIKIFICFASMIFIILYKFDVFVFG